MTHVYRTTGGEFVVRFDASTIDQMLRYCRTAKGHETGGILVGLYEDDHRCAHVTHVSGPPHGSKHGRSTFFRAVGHLQEWVDGLWSGRKGHYIGEWHYHPGGSPRPSDIDRRQLRKIATDSNAACPEPVLAIVGGDAERQWSLSVTVFTRSGMEQPLSAADRRSEG